MKTAVVSAPGNLQLVDTEVPSAGDCDLVVKVASAGICGTDLHFVRMGPLFGQAMPLGHEFAGEVVEIGNDVTSFKLGDRVAYNSYNSSASLGRGGESGGFSPYVVLRNVDKQAEALCLVPPNLQLEYAALVEPISVGAHAVNRAAPKPGESVAIFGVGPIGLGAIAALRWQGIDDIVAFDLSPLRRERALALGARAVFDPRTNPPQQALSELRGTAELFGQSYAKTDIFIEASGAPGLLADLARFCGKGSRIVTLAIQQEATTLDGTMLMTKEVSIIGSSGYPSEFPYVMQKLSERQLDPELFITHRYPFTKFLDAFETASNPSVAAKVLLDFD